LVSDLWSIDDSSLTIHTTSWVSYKVHLFHDRLRLVV